MCNLYLNCGQRNYFGVWSTSIIVHQVQPGWFGIDTVKLATEKMSENQNSY